MSSLGRRLIAAAKQANAIAQAMTDDDENYPPEGGCLGTGALHDLMGGPTRKKIVKHPMGFIHFPDKPEKKPRPVRARAVKAKPKRRKR